VSGAAWAEPVPGGAGALRVEERRSGNRTLGRGLT